MKYVDGIAGFFLVLIISVPLGNADTFPTVELAPGSGWQLIYEFSDDADPSLMSAFITVQYSNTCEATEIDHFVMVRIVIGNLIPLEIYSVTNNSTSAFSTILERGQAIYGLCLEKGCKDGPGGCEYTLSIKHRYYVH